MDVQATRLTEDDALERMDAACEALPAYPGGFAGRGIVIPAGGERLFTCAWVCIHMLRKMGCALPVELWHLGPEEMTDEMRSLVAPLGVQCVDAREVRLRWPARILNGWEIKCFAVSYCRFEEVLLLDADNVPVADPEFLFESGPYREHGAIFWPDRVRLKPSHPIWGLTGVPCRDEPQVESGQMVVDKARCWGPLRLAGWMNDNSDFWYRHFHGDKETYHMAWRKLGREYAMPDQGLEDREGVMCQHDFAGRRIFQHRSGRKWTLNEENRPIAGLLFEDECIAAVEALGRAWRRPSRYCDTAATADQREAARSLCARGWVYQRVGHDERPMTFGLDGKVEEGAGDRERAWGFEGDNLCLLGHGGLTCRLARAGIGRWKGRWLVQKRMAVELIAETGPATGAGPRPMRLRDAGARRRLVYSTNSRYFDMLRVSISSFLRHNDAAAWAIGILDVGLSNGQRQIFQRMGIDVVTYPAHHRALSPALTYPATWSRLKMLDDFTADGEMLLYLDADSLVLGSVEPMVADFLTSGEAIGLATEIGDTIWEPPRMSRAFRDGPPEEFPGYERWKDHLVMNTGVLLARGPVAGELGRRCTALYPSVSGSASFAEQSILDAVLLEDGCSWWEIPQCQHCMVRADLIEHAGPIHEGGATYRGEKIVVRHFCGVGQKNSYEREVLPAAREFFGV